MADRSTQAALGLYVGTSIYLMIVLRSIYGESEGIPNLAVTIGTALVILSMLTLPVFVHHLARSIITDEVIERVGRALDAAAARLLPEAGHAPAHIEIQDARASAPLTLSAGGYVQAIDFERLVKLAADSDCIIQLDVRAGHHGVRGAPYAWVTPASAVTDDLRDAATGSLVMGAVRTEYQDLEFSIRQLVELSLRALSPGINDPYTAQAAIDQLARSLAFIMTRGAAQSAWRDEEGNVRVLLPAVTFDGLVDEALTQIRQVAADKPAVLIRLAEKIGQLLPLATAEQTVALRKHLDLVEAAGKRNIPEPMDLDALEEHIGRARAATAAPQS
jgi:uncharacterized membrane protein